jgi:hypothetical protein
VLLHVPVLTVLTSWSEDASPGGAAGGHRPIVNDDACEVLVAQPCEFRTVNM